MAILFSLLKLTENSHSSHPNDFTSSSLIELFTGFALSLFVSCLFLSVILGYSLLHLKVYVDLLGGTSSKKTHHRHRRHHERREQKHSACALHVDDIMFDDDDYFAIDLPTDLVCVYSLIIYFFLS